MHCGKRISGPGWRFDVRVKRSHSLRDQKRIHPDCLGSLGANTPGLEASLRTLVQWKTQPGIEQPALDMLEAVHAALRGFAVAPP